MNDYISRYDAMLVPPLPKEYREYTTMNLDDAYELGWDDALQNLKNVPAADVRPVVRGEWVETIEYNGWEDVRCASCSACGESYVLDKWKIDDLKGLFNFCPNCGTDMRKEVER